MALALAVGDVEAVEPVAVDRRAVAGVAPRPSHPSGGCDGADDRQVVGRGEVPVPLVLGRARP